MRKSLVIGAVVAVATAGVIVVATHRPPVEQQPVAVPSQQVDSTTDPTDRPASGATLQDLLSTRMTTLGSEISVGLPATLTVETSTGMTIYARVTVHELAQLPADQSSRVLGQHDALARYSTVWTMPVSMTVLGIVDADGTETLTTADVSATDLSRFTIATHPGSDPLPTSNTITSLGCAGLDGHTQVSSGRTVTWCVHGFSDATTAAPTGGQYQTVSGAYATPITWASKEYATPEIP